MQLCWLSLLPIRTIENAVADTWRNISHELDRIQLVTLQTPSGTVPQRTRLTGRQRDILTKLGLGDPPRCYRFEPTGDRPPAAPQVPSACGHTPDGTYLPPKLPNPPSQTPLNARSVVAYTTTNCGSPVRLRLDDDGPTRRAS